MKLLSISEAEETIRNKIKSLDRSVLKVSIAEFTNKLIINEITEFYKAYPKQAILNGYSILKGIVNKFINAYEKELGAYGNEISEEIEYINLKTFWQDNFGRILNKVIVS